MPGRRVRSLISLALHLLSFASYSLMECVPTLSLEAIQSQVSKWFIFLMFSGSEVECRIFIYAQSDSRISSAEPYALENKKRLGSYTYLAPATWVLSLVEFHRTKKAPGFPSLGGHVHSTHVHKDKIAGELKRLPRST